MLLFANKTEDDIVLREEIERLGGRVKVYYIVDEKRGEDWKGFTGYVRREVLEELSKLDERDTFYASCGPRGMNELVRKIIEEFPESKYFKL